MSNYEDWGEVVSEVFMEINIELLKEREEDRRKGGYR